ncbi:MAG: GDSL-type esterase/lipase family protein, partial [Mucilaginibacter sp.]
MFKFFSNSVVLISLALTVAWGYPATAGQPSFYKASDKNFQYFGRIDFSHSELPRYWAAGVYIKANFSGTSCQIVINDEVIYDKDHNYISIIVDNLPVKRIKLTQKRNVITAATGLADTKHTITICKATESGIGYLEFVGMSCKKLLPASPKPVLKMEFIGNSITCGTGSDTKEIPCDSGTWYDQHNAYMSYGALTARALNAQWHLSSVSGIGLTKSCCGMDVVMPDVMDKINMRANTIKWDFKKYQPDVVTVCLGQNDGIVDSALFCSAYVKFVDTLRLNYPKATVVCLTSPMASPELVAVQKKYLTAITG